jgi:hypothetical protein
MIQVNDKNIGWIEGYRRWGGRIENAVKKGEGHEILKEGVPPEPWSVP